MPEVLTMKEKDAPGCYCVCHSPYSSRLWCEHCKGDNEAGRRYRERQKLEREVIEAAKEDLASETRKEGDHGIDRLIAARRRYRAAVIALLEFESSQQQVKK